MTVLNSNAIIPFLPYLPAGTSPFPLPAFTVACAADFEQISSGSVIDPKTVNVAGLLRRREAALTGCGVFDLGQF